MLALTGHTIDKIHNMFRCKQKELNEKEMPGKMFTCNEWCMLCIYMSIICFVYFLQLSSKQGYKWILYIANI